MIIFRDPQAHTLLRAWITENRIQHAQVQENKMQLFDYHAMCVFNLTWTQGWDQITVWDAWHRRHIYQST